MLNRITFLRTLLYSLTIALSIGFLASPTQAQISPFDDLRWKGSEPQVPMPEVKMDSTWYSVVTIESHSIADILKAAEKEYGPGMVQRRFREDLLDVLELLGDRPETTVDMTLKNLASGELVDFLDAKMTREKRQALRLSAVRESAERANQGLSVKQAQEDLAQFRKILEEQSSYLFLHGKGALEALDAFEKEVRSLESVSSNAFEIGLTRILGLVGDRHASIRSQHGLRVKSEAYLPFALAPLSGQAVAVVPSAGGTYDLFDASYPFLASIDGCSVPEWIDRGSLRAKHAPQEAKWFRGMRDMTKFAQYRVIAGETADLKVKLVFLNATKKRSEAMELSAQRIRWQPMDLPDPRLDPDQLFRMLDDQIAYMRVPSMWSRSEEPALFEAMHAQMQAFKDSTALVIDLRHNGGGVRDFMIDIAPYFMAADAKAWVANVARVRTDELLEPGTTMNGMERRYLLPRDSQAYSDEDRASIDDFMEGFAPKWRFEETRFSENHYLLLRAKSGEPYYHYKKPVFVLTNERSFSAASVFAACMKGFGNVRIAGVRTDGSSGRSMRALLKNSGLRLRFSTMISFQRNGETLDGNGTEPDLHIPADMDQILGKKDTQLETLLDHINNL